MVYNSKPTKIAICVFSPHPRGYLILHLSSHSRPLHYSISLRSSEFSAQSLLAAKIFVVDQREKEKRRRKMGK